MKKTILTAAVLAIGLATPAYAGQMSGDKLEGSMGGDPLDIATGSATTSQKTAPSQEAGDSDKTGTVERAVAGKSLDPEELLESRELSTTPSPTQNGD